MKSETKELLELPSIIESKEKEILAINLKINELKYFIDSWELPEMRKISEELKDGKKIYPNEDIRKAELDKRRKESNDLIVTIINLKEKELKEKEEEIKLRYLQNRFKAINKYIDFITAGRMESE